MSEENQNDNPFALPRNYAPPKIREKLSAERRRAALAQRPPRPKPPKPPPPPPTLAITKRGRLRPTSGEISSDMISNLLDTDGIRDFLSRSSPRDKSRMAALLYTLYPAKKVGLMMALSSKQVHRYYDKHLDELQSAMQARNSIIAGLAERRAVEALQRINIDEIPDERKPRAIKDLVDSAAVVRESIKPPEPKDDESTMELIFRIKQRGQRIQRSEEKSIEAEYSEQSAGETQE